MQVKLLAGAVIATTTIYYLSSIFSGKVIFFGAILGGVGMLGWIKKKRKKASLALADQVEYPHVAPLDVAPGMPMFHGVRVVELATVVAAPSCATIMSAHGAEVVKLEEPKGDYWRKFFLEFEQTPKPRAFASVFETSNFNKTSVVLDLRLTEDMVKFKKILKDADVFITNLRVDGLVRLGIDYDSIKNDFPKLIYAHLTAWGRSGPDYALPGYDLGAFWAMSGMSGLVHDDEVFAGYPVAMGDTATGSNLVGGVALALAHRMKTGRGQLVDASLMNAGLYCVAPYVTGAAPSTDIPDYNNAPALRASLNGALWANYGSADRVFFFLTVLGDEEDVRARLSEEFKVKLSGKRTALGEEEDVQELKRCFSNMQWKSIEAGLLKCGVPHVRSIEMMDMHEKDQPLAALYESAETYFKIPGVDDLTADAINLPWDARSVPLAIVRRAPHKGEHTKSFFKKGWSPRNKTVEKSLFNQPQDDDKKEIGGAVLSSTVVVELSGNGLSAGAAAMQLADSGATVYKVEPPQGDLWRERNPKLFRHLNRGKKSVVADLTQQTGVACVHALLQSADVLVTNLPYSQLKAYGLDYDSLKDKYPNLVYALVTPFGKDADPKYEKVGDLGAYWGASSIGLGLTPPGTGPAYFPMQLGELITSMHLFSALGSALFHAMRTGQGQLVETSLLRVGLWSNQQLYAILSKDPSKAPVFNHTEDRFLSFPVPTANAFRTKDGMWVQLLGVETPRHLGKTIKALGLRMSLYPRIVSTVLFKVIPRKTSTKILKVFPLFQLLNAAFSDAIGKLTWKECKAIFAEHDIWHCFVALPAQAVAHEQARKCKMFLELDNSDGSTHLVASPVKLSENVNLVSTEAPKLGAD